MCPKFSNSISKKHGPTEHSSTLQTKRAVLVPDASIPCLYTLLCMIACDVPPEPMALPIHMSQSSTDRDMFTLVVQLRRVCWPVFEVHEFWA